jgi:hypothetical protein
MKKKRDPDESGTVRAFPVLFSMWLWKSISHIQVSVIW